MCLHRCCTIHNVHTVLYEVKRGLWIEHQIAMCEKPRKHTFLKDYFYKTKHTAKRFLNGLCRFFPSLYNGLFLFLVWHILLNFICIASCFKGMGLKYPFSAFFRQNKRKKDWLGLKSSCQKPQTGVPLLPLTWDSSTRKDGEMLDMCFNSWDTWNSRTSRQFFKGQPLWS